MNGDILKVVKFATDITEVVSQQHRFNLLSLVADETDNSVVIADANGLIEYTNPGFTKLTGYEFEEVQGRKPGGILQGEHTDKETVARIREDIKNRTPCYHEILITKGNCRSLFYMFVSVLFLNLSGMLRMILMDSIAQLTVDIIAKVVESRITITNAAKLLSKSRRTIERYVKRYQQGQVLWSFKFVLTPVSFKKSSLISAPELDALKIITQ
jgi:PAS domain S-box-containing protein